MFSLGILAQDYCIAVPSDAPLPHKWLCIHQSLPMGHTLHQLQKQNICNVSMQFSSGQKCTNWSVQFTILNNNDCWDIKNSIYCHWCSQHVPCKQLVSLMPNERETSFSLICHRINQLIAKFTASVCSFKTSNFSANLLYGHIRFNSCQFHTYRHTYIIYLIHT